MGTEEKQMGSELGLLDRLYEMVDCEYLSSLKETALREKLIQSISQIPVHEHTFKEWSGAFSYLFGDKIQFTSGAEIKSYIETKRTAK